MKEFIPILQRKWIKIFETDKTNVTGYWIRQIWARNLSCIGKPLYYFLYNYAKIVVKSLNCYFL